MKERPEYEAPRDRFEPDSLWRYVLRNLPVVVGVILSQGLVAVALIAATGQIFDYRFPESLWNWSVVGWVAAAVGALLLTLILVLRGRQASIDRLKLADEYEKLATRITAAHRSPSR